MDRPSGAVGFSESRVRGLVITKSRLGEGCHSPLVDREIYDAVQSLIEALLSIPLHSGRPRGL